jgi:hypothetical protein
LPFWLVSTVIAMLFTPGPPPPGPGVNSIAITVDTSQKGKIIAVGTYTTADKVTLTEVTLYALPVPGGRVATPASGGKIDNTKKTWGPGTIDTHLYKGQYAIRADGKFSDGSVVSSVYLVQQVNGDPPPPAELTLAWKAGFPISTESKKIKCEGTYTGTPNLKKEGFLQALPLTGGKEAQAVLKMVQVGPGVGDWKGEPDIPVPTGGVEYTVFGVANDAGDKEGKNPKTFCTPYHSVKAAP